MELPPHTPGERERLEALWSYSVLDTGPEASYDEATALAALVCEAPFSLITLVDQDRQWFKSRHGWDVAQSERSISFCAHAIAEPDLMVVPDATEDSRFHDNPDVIGGPGIRFYAGAPLVNPEGHAVGTLCVLDRVPRTLTQDQEQALRVLRNHVMTLLELRRSNRRLDLNDEILNSLPGIFYLFDRNRRFVRWNRQFERTTGYSREELADLDPLNLFHGGDRDHIDERIRKAFETGAAEAQADLVAKDGTTTTHYFTGRRLEVEGAPCLVGMGVDISRRRELERERDQLFNLLPDLLCVVGFDGRFRDANPAWERVLGYSREDLLGRSFSDFIHPEDVGPTQLEFEANLQGSETGSFENRYRHKNGHWRWMSWSSSIDPARQVIFGVARDVTREKEVASALRESEERYRTVVESARDAIVTLAPDGTVASVNQAFEAITRWARETRVGRSYEELLDPDARPLGRELMEKLARGESMPVFEVSVLAENGGRIPVEITAAALEWTGGERGALLVARDVRARRALDERLRRVQRLDAVGRLAAGVAHDFNNVLGVVLAEADLLLETDGLPEDVAEGVEHIREAAGRGAGLTGRLMTLSRDRDRELRPVELNGVVDGFTSMLRRLVRKDCIFEMRLAQERTTVMCDPRLLEQVLMNLVINASDAMPPGGTLTLSTSAVELDEEAVLRYPNARSGRYVRLSVADTGKGIPPENLTQIFEPLFTTKQEGEGTGLGLTTVHSIVQQHGGWVDVESEPGVGTNFHLLFPSADGTGSTEPGA